jgi:hypothetical protein
MKTALHQRAKCHPITVDFRTMPYLPHDGDALHKLAATGMSLHLFTETVGESSDIGASELEHAHSTLTAQIEDMLHDPEWPNRVLRLVTDPDRSAGVGGRTAAEICGSSWPDVERLARERATAAAQATVEPTVVLRLAAVHAFSSDWCWLGTLGRIA